MGHGADNPRERYTISGRIAADLRVRIAAGEFPDKPGHIPDQTPLPSETALMAQYDTSKDTVRRAIEILRDQGLVFTVPQIGTFVRKPD